MYSCENIKYLLNKTKQCKNLSFKNKNDSEYKIIYQQPTHNRHSKNTHSLPETKTNDCLTPQLNVELWTPVLPVDLLSTWIYSEGRRHSWGLTAWMVMVMVIGCECCVCLCLCVGVCMHACVLVIQSGLTLCDPMDCSLSVSSVRRIL